MKWRLIFAGFLLATGSLCQFSIDVNTDLVTVTVTASDMNGQPAEDLKANDFRVTEDGKPQQVAIFLYRKLDIDEPLAEIPAARPTSPEGVRTQTVSARWTQPDNLVHRRLLAMVFDFSTMAIPAQAHARQSAIDFIRKDLKPADLATVMATTGGKLEILQNFTDDRAALAAAVSKVRGGDQPDSDILSAHGKLIAIEDACRQLSAPRLVGNKALLYFSDRFPLPGLYIQTAWTNTANRCIRANTAIYPITEANDSLETRGHHGRERFTASQRHDSFDGIGAGQDRQSLCCWLLLHKFEARWRVPEGECRNDPRRYAIALPTRLFRRYISLVFPALIAQSYARISRTTSP